MCQLERVYSWVGSLMVDSTYQRHLRVGPCEWRLCVLHSLYPLLHSSCKAHGMVGLRTIVPSSFSSASHDLISLPRNNNVFVTRTSSTLFKCRSPSKKKSETRFRITIPFKHKLGGKNGQPRFDIYQYFGGFVFIYYVDPQCLRSVSLIIQ